MNKERLEKGKKKLLSNGDSVHILLKGADDGMPSFCSSHMTRGKRVIYLCRRR